LLFVLSAMAVSMHPIFALIVLSAVNGFFFHHQQKTYVSDTFDPLRPLTAVFMFMLSFLWVGTTFLPRPWPSRHNSPIQRLFASHF
jgi:hypothetical protein